VNSMLIPQGEHVGDTSNEIRWESDYRFRMNPELLSRLLREAVPSLAWVDWRVTEIEEGRAVTVLPLNANSTNQHGTHQAALLALAADYTGGAALTSLIRGVPFVGVHPQVDTEGAAMWLANFDVKYQQPSTSDVVLTAEIPQAKWDRIRRRYRAGQMVLEEVEISFESEAGRIATGKCTYVLKQAKKMRPTTINAVPNAIFAEQTKASARLIAGVRHLETIRENGIVRDEFAGRVCGEHGHLLARRFTHVLPALQPMVAARTKNADDLIEDRVRIHRCHQLVLIGVGLDCRPYRLTSLRNGECRVFALDLPHMLLERAKALAHAGIDNCFPSEVRVPIDLQLQQVSDVLLMPEYGFDPLAPTVFVMEGCSMYQTIDSFRGLLSSVRRLLKHPESIFWIDIVKEVVVSGKAPEKEIQEFLEGMRQLGEPFTLGFDDLSSAVSGLGFRVSQKASPADYFAGCIDPVLGYYDFYVLSSTSAE
jgi:methyltransferase (TIGR00027 family)